MNNELVSLYKSHILMIWLLKFTPIVIIIAIGYKLTLELIKIKDSIPTWLLIALISLFTIGAIGIIIALLNSFLTELFETKRKLNDANQEKSEVEK